MDDIDEVGYKAWDEFYNQMERRFRLSRGRRQYWGHKYYRTFRKIAQKCIKSNVNVTDLITIGFELIQKNHTYIVPKDFANDWLFDSAITRARELKTPVEMSWGSQISELSYVECDLIPDIYPNEEELLLDSRLPFTAWFRVLYSMPFSDRLFKMYGETAWVQLQENVRLRQYLRKHASANMKELETRLGKFCDALTEEVV
jgi:hypothetical protein